MVSDTNAELVPDSFGACHDLVAYKYTNGLHVIEGDHRCNVQYWLMIWSFIVFCIGFWISIYFISRQSFSGRGALFAVPATMVIAAAITTPSYYGVKRYRVRKAAAIGRVIEYDERSAIVRLRGDVVVGHLSHVSEIAVVSSGYIARGHGGSMQFSALNQVHVVLASGDSASTAHISERKRVVVLTVMGYGHHTRRAVKQLASGIGVKCSRVRVPMLSWPDYLFIRSIIRIPLWW